MSANEVTLKDTDELTRTSVGWNYRQPNSLVAQNMQIPLAPSSSENGRNLTPISTKNIPWTYAKFKNNFGIESHLVNVENPRRRAAISKLRTSAHVLAVGRGYLLNPKRR